MTRARYPGLPQHPQYARATELLRHYDDLLSFELVDGADYVDTLDHLRYAMRATYLDDTRTLVVSVTLAICWEMSTKRRASMDIADSPVHVSIGIENEAGLVADSTQMLDTTAVA